MKKQIFKIEIYNILENILIFKTENEKEFISFANIIRVENDDFSFSIIKTLDAIEYFNNYCHNLKLIKL